MVVENLDGHRENKFGMHHVKPKNNNTDDEEVLIPFTMKSYTFSYEAAGLKSPDENNQHTSVISPKPVPAFEFGTAFEFSQDYLFDDQKTSKVKKKKKKSVLDDDIAAEDEEVPTHYQSIFTYESAFLDDSKFSHFHEEEPTSLRLPKTKKLIIFRLGKVLKPRGPGSSSIDYAAYPRRLNNGLKSLASGSESASALTLRLWKNGGLMMFFTTPKTITVAGNLVRMLNIKFPSFLRKQCLPMGLIGCILILPFVDECHIVDLAEQSLAVKPLMVTWLMVRTVLPISSSAGDLPPSIGCGVFLYVIFELRRTEPCSLSDTRVSGKPSIVKMQSGALIVTSVFFEDIDTTSSHLECESTDTK
ncbi:hypothetical protein ACTXT7_010260 [Hymenolepis weldensis]